jgi:hypothetical protein
MNKRVKGWKVIVLVLLCSSMAMGYARVDHKTGKLVDAGLKCNNGTHNPPPVNPPPPPPPPPPTGDQPPPQPPPRPPKE